MRLLMLHPHDPRYCPWTIRIIKLAEALAESGHEPTVVFPDLEMKIENLAQLRKQKVWEIPESGPVAYRAILGRDRHLFRNMRQLLRDSGGFDLVHIQKCYPNAVLPGLFVAYLCDLPVHYDWDDNEAAILDSLPPGELYPFRRLAKYFERKLPSYVETVTVSSEGIRQMAMRAGVAEKRMFKLPVGADLDNFKPDLSGDEARKWHDLGPAEEHPVILYQGQLEGAHHADLFVDAAPRVLEEFPAARFLLVGGGRGQEAHRARAIEHGLADRVIFTGYVKRERVPHYVAAADVVVASFESNAVTRCKSPLKLAEYLAGGKAVVASEVGDVGMMLGDAGVLVQPGDSAALAEGILQLLRDPERRKMLEVRARRRAERIYNWRRGAETLEEAYEQAHTILFHRGTARRAPT